MNYGSLPNYIPAYNGPKIITPAQYEVLAAHEQWAGTVTEFQSQLVDADFVQPRQTWQTLGLTAGQQENFVGNVAASLSGAVPQVRNDAYGMCFPEDTSVALVFCQEGNVYADLVFPYSCLHANRFAAWRYGHEGDGGCGREQDECEEGGGAAEAQGEEFQGVYECEGEHMIVKCIWELKDRWLLESVASDWEAVGFLYYDLWWLFSYIVLFLQ
jgi:hypothetical protein